VYVNNDGERMNGVALIAAEPRELTVVYVDGPIDLKHLSDLAGIDIGAAMGGAIGAGGAPERRRLPSLPSRPSRRRSSRRAAKKTARATRCTHQAARAIVFFDVPRRLQRATCPFTKAAMSSRT
jgi:hypothetical protein